MQSKWLMVPRWAFSTDVSKGSRVRGRTFYSSILALHFHLVLDWRRATKENNNTAKERVGYNRKNTHQLDKS
jgi:hypothetical protein